MMTRLSAAAFAVALLVTARPAQADPVADFRTGTTVMVRLVTVDLGGGPHTSGGVLVSKPAGTLDVELQAADLGIPVPATLRLRGSSVGDGRILYTIDESYAPAIDLGFGQRLSRVRGHLYVAASRIRGTALPDHQLGNARLLSADTSGYLEAHGSWGVRRVGIPKLDLLGGLPQVPLAAFVDGGGRIACSDRVATTHALTVSLTDAAPAYGTVVDLAGPRSGVRLPNVAVVPAGRRSAPVTAVIDPSFAGTVRLTAAAGGVTRSFELVVRAPRECQ